MIKKVLKKMLNMLGLKVNRVTRGRVPDADRFKWLKDMQINTIIDVGGSKGNATLEFKKLFPSATVYAFEPLPDVFKRMQEKVAHLHDVYLFNIALSDQKGTAEIHRSSYSGSSSLLPMAHLHKKLFPITAGEHLLPIETDTLDAVLRSKTLKGPILMKIDVQGFEDKVLAGAKEILKSVSVIIVEVSFKELYVGQPMFGDIYKLLTESGFKYIGSWDQDFRSPEDGAERDRGAG